MAQNRKNQKALSRSSQSDDGPAISLSLKGGTFAAYFLLDEFSLIHVFALRQMLLVLGDFDIARLEVHFLVLLVFELLICPVRNEEKKFNGYLFGDSDKTDNSLR